MDYMKNALETVCSIYRMLEDDESKEIYITRLAYWCSNKNLKYLAALEYMYKKKSISAVMNVPEIGALIRILPKDRDIVLYGAGVLGAALLPCFKNDKRFIGFCSSTVKKQESGYQDYPVMSPEELLSRKDLSVVVSTSDFEDAIMQKLADGGYPKDLIFSAIPYFFPDLGESELYFGPAFMKFKDEEVFVDAGCLNFETSLDFAKHCKCLKRVYAFEPDPNNYQECLKKIQKRNPNRIQDVRIFSSGVWSKKTMLCFDARGNGGSSFCEEGMRELSVPVVPIDDVIEPGDQVTTIKMDVEGSELEALKGARKTILRDHPKLAICLYHKMEDLWEIPTYIKELVPEYRLYIRQHDYDTVLYAVIP